MRLPTAAEIEGPLGKPGAPRTEEDILRARDTATRALEILTDTPIRQRTVTEKRLIQPGSLKLEHFPARDATINGAKAELIRQLGIIFTDLPPSNYTITYTVGYEADDLPAITVAAITNLTRLRLTGDPEHREAALAEIEVLRLQRAAQRRERENA